MTWDHTIHRRPRGRILRPSTEPDEFAPHSGPGRCVDSAGYVRDEHDYLIDARDGTRCCWCLRLRRMEPL